MKNHSVPAAVAAALANKPFANAFGLRLPEQFVANAGVMFTAGRWTAKLDVSNRFDETYFRTRTGDMLGNPLAQVMPDRRWQITLKSEF